MVEPDLADAKDRKQAPTFPKLYEAARSWWAAPAFFLLLSVVYFAEFVFTDHVLAGLDLGTNLHRGNESFLDKVSLLEPANWSNRTGGIPGSGVRIPLYFPVRLIYLFTGYFQTVGWCYVFSMFAAGWFAFLAIRGLRCNALAALIGGAAYASSPVLLTYTYAGHDSKMLVIALFPLMIWGLVRGLDTKRPIYFLALAGSIGAGIYSPHLEMLTCALGGVGFCFIWWTAAAYVRDRDARALGVRSLMSAGALALGLGIGAMGVFPQSVYAKTESRGGDISRAPSWALHPEEIASLVVPDFTGSDEGGRRQYWGRNPSKVNSDYVGIVALFFAAVAVARVRRDPRIAPLCILSLIAMCYALGPHTPVRSFFQSYVPGARSLQPGLVCFLFAMPMCLLAAVGLHTVLDAGPDASARLKRIAAGSAIAFVLLTSVALSSGSALELWTSAFWPDIPAEKALLARANLPAFGRGAGIAAFLVAALGLLTAARLQNRLSPSSFAVMLLPLIVFDTWRIDQPFLKYEDPDRQPTIEQTYPGVIGFLRSQEGRFRVLSEPNLPDDIDVTKAPDERFTTMRYSDFIRHMDRWAWFGRGLDLLNNRFVITRSKLRNRSDLEVVKKVDGVVIQENPNPLPRFYLVPKSRVIASKEQLFKELMLPHVKPERTVLLEVPPSEISLAETGDQARDRLKVLRYDEKEGSIVLDIEADGPRFLVVCENYHPNWRATLDGKQRTVYRANYIWKAVQIPRGRHRLELSYEDPFAVACRWVTAGATLLWAGAIASIVCRGKLPSDLKEA